MGAFLEGGAFDRIHAELLQMDAVAPYKNDCRSAAGRTPRPPRGEHAAGRMALSDTDLRNQLCLPCCVMRNGPLIAVKSTGITGGGVGG